MDETVGGLAQPKLQERWNGLMETGANGISDNLKLRDDEGNICQLKIGKKPNNDGYYLYLIDHNGRKHINIT